MRGTGWGTARLLVLVIGGLLGATCAAQAAESGEPVREVLIGSGEWTPYVESARADAGPLGRLISAIFARAGYRVRYVMYPWERDVYLLKRGDLDGIMPYICTPQRQTFSLCGEPLVRSQMVFFQHRDNPAHWRTVADLQRVRIAVTQGYAYGELFDQARAGGRLQLQQSSDEAHGMRLLLAGRADFHPQDRAVGYAMLLREFTPAERQQLSHNPHALGRNDLTLLLRQDARGEQLRQVFNAGVRALRESGDLQRLQQALDHGTAAGWRPR